MPCQVGGPGKWRFPRGIPAIGCVSLVHLWRCAPIRCTQNPCTLPSLRSPFPSSPPLDNLLAALLLGIIEGVTEFLPISSTGHLLLAERWLGARSDLFNIAIQAGAILAVVLVYRQRLVQLAWSFLGRGGKADAQSADADPDAVALAQPPRDYALKLAGAFLVTAVLGLLVKKLGWQLDDAVAPIAWALVLGGAWMLLAEHFAAKRAAVLGERADITWLVAVLVGVAQVVAGVFPGTSRSAATIFVALLFGVTNRAAATEFAFLVGIPTMFAASGYEFAELVVESGIH